MRLWFEFRKVCRVERIWICKMLTLIYIGSTCLCRPLYQVPAPGAEAEKSNEKSPLEKASPKPSPPLSVTPLPSAPTPNRVQKRSRRQNSLQSSSEAVAKGLAVLTGVPEKPREALIDSGFENSGNQTATTPSQCHVPIVPQEAYRRSHLPIRTDTRRESLSTPAPRSYSSPILNLEQDSGNPARVSTPECPAPCCSKPQDTQHSALGTGNFASQQPVSTLAYQSAQSTYTYAPPARPPFAPQRPSSAAPKIETTQMQPDSHISAIPMVNYSSSFAFPSSSTSTQPIPRHITGIPHFPQDFSSPLSNYFPQNFVGFESHPGHNCGCGDTCQCLGCASHPFNDTTRQYIQEMGYMALGDADENQPTSPYNGHDFSTSLETYNPQNIVYGQNNTNQEPSSSLANNNPIPSPGVYSQHYEQLMQPAAYYTLEYPVGMPDLSPCNNIMGTCQCGISCSCTGCLTHTGHNGLALEPSPPPDRLNEELMQNPNTPIQYQAPPSS